MNFLKKGPELKLSEIKVPGFLQDVYYDLKDRHLLPVAIVLVVAIFAVPIVLSQSSGSETAEPAEASAGGATASASGATAKELVSKSAPGLRDYRRRLRRLRAKDPFAQQYAETNSASASAEEPSEFAPESSTGPAPVEESTTTPASPTTESEVPGEPNPGGLTYFSYAIDVRISAGGSQDGESSSSDGQPSVRRNLPELTMIPSRQTPALVYMGSSKDGKKALMLVSSDVKGIFGDAKCVLGSETCELLALEPGLPETVVYGNAGKTYKVELVKIHLVKTKDLNRAPLGGSGDSGSGSHPHQHGQRLAVGAGALLPAH